jgi:hypothetical protein
MSERTGGGKRRGGGSFWVISTFAMVGMGGKVGKAKR